MENQTDQDEAKRRYADSAKLDREERQELFRRKVHEGNDRKGSGGTYASKSVGTDSLTPTEPAPAAGIKTGFDAPLTGHDPWDWEPADEGPADNPNRFVDKDL